MPLRGALEDENHYALRADTCAALRFAVQVSADPRVSDLPILREQSV
jgi:hypothetical protein